MSAAEIQKYFIPCHPVIYRHYRVSVPVILIIAASVRHPRGDEEHHTEAYAVHTFLLNMLNIRTERKTCPVLRKQTPR